MRRCLVDTNVFLYARGLDHRYRDPCRAVLRAGRAGELGLEASVELIQEFTHVILRRGLPRDEALEEASEVRAQCRLHDFDAPVLSECLRLLGRHTALGVRDAVHAATALRSDITEIVSADAAFDGVDGVSRLDPVQLAATLDEPGRPRR